MAGLRGALDEFDRNGDEVTVVQPANGCSQVQAYGLHRLQGATECIGFEAGIFGDEDVIHAAK